MNSKIKILLASGVLALGAQQASAISVGVGAGVGAVAEPDPSGGSVVATHSALYTGINPPNNFSGRLDSWVVSGDANNPYGGLTFVYQLFSDSASLSEIHRLTVEGFAGFKTDMSYITHPGEQVPDEFTRSSALNSGDVIGFNFDPPGVVDPSEWSAWLVVQTDATHHILHQANVIDGATAVTAALAPRLPDGGTTAVLLGFGLLGLAGMRRKLS